MRFNENFKYYNNFAHIQKLVAKNLIDFSNKNNNYSDILEIGCGTGIFTNEIIKNLNYTNLFINDLYDTRSFFSPSTYNEFIKGDMDTLDFQKMSLIVSSSVFQWSKNLDLLLKKLSNVSNHLLFSIYIKGNLKEIEEHFSISLDYKDVSTIVEILKKYYKNVKYFQEEIPLIFETPLDALRHLKFTGVTGFSNKSTVSKIRRYNSNVLTYKVAYFLCEV